MEFSIPKDEIRWLVGRCHISRSDESIRADIRERLQRAKREGKVTDADITACELFAVKCHHDNRKEYAFVMGGH